MQAPVGSVGCMGNKGKRIEQNVFHPHDSPKLPFQASPEFRHTFHLCLEIVEHLCQGRDDREHPLFTIRGILDCIEILERLLQKPCSPCGRIDKLLEEIGVPPMNKHTTDNTHQEPRRTPGHTEFFQLIEHPDTVFPQKIGQQLPVGGGCIIKRYFSHRC